MRVGSRVAFSSRRSALRDDPQRVTFVDRLVGWRHAHFGGVSGSGMLLAVAAYIGAYTPSLLPRPWPLQGLVAGICGVLGYVVGLWIGAAIGAFARWADLRVSIRPSARRALLRAWLATLVLVVLAFPLTTLAWQRYAAQYVGFAPPGVGFVLGSTAVAVVVFAVFIGLWRLIAGLVDWLTRRLRSRLLWASAAHTVATVLTVVIVAVVVDQVVLRGGFALASREADRVNAATPAGQQAPTSTLRSGGPGSSQTWESLGQDGAFFVSRGPDADAIARVTGRPADDPIRLFAGYSHDRSLEQIRDAVLAEMDRTHAFERRAIYVVTATSTGYINDWSVSSLEYLFGGDTATVSMAYSTLPSAIALLSERTAPPQAARLLLTSVRERLAAIPKERRPKLYVGGESLGAYGGNGAFDSPEAMLAEVDGALWTGTPSFTPNHATLTGRRAFGSTEVNPVVDGGLHVRFAGRAAELTADQYGHRYGEWRYPRVAYLQHESDPVVWWGPDLLLRTPDWLRETRVGDTMATMSWLPLVTFWQVSADMAVSNNVPGGFGHRYFEFETLPAWAAIVGNTDTALQRRIMDAIAQQTRGGSLLSRT